MKKVVYTALFVDDPEELKKEFSPVFPNEYYHHSTIEFRPENIDGLEVGKRHVLKVTGRVTAEEIDVLLVEGNVKSVNKHPHITLSTPEGIKPDMSKDAIGDAFRDGTVQKLDKPVEVNVTEGYFDGKRVITS